MLAADEEVSEAGACVVDGGLGFAVVVPDFGVVCALTTVESRHARNTKRLTDERVFMGFIQRETRRRNKAAASVVLRVRMNWRLMRLGEGTAAETEVSREGVEVSDRSKEEAESER